MISFFKPQIGQEERQAVMEVLDSGQWTLGEEVAKFEEEFAKYINAPYVVAVDNCTNALFLALEGSKKDTLVKCPAMTFASVAHVISQTNNQIEFSDDYHAGSKYLLGHTNIWDCAHEIQRGMYETGQIQCFSFYPNKLLSSMEGGAIATDDKYFAQWLKLARNNGRKSRTFYDYDIEFIGWKMNMTNIQAALARIGLQKLDQQLLDREVIRSIYLNEFEQVNKGNYLFVIKVKNRDEFMRKMLEAGIETSYHYKPLYDQEAYKIHEMANMVNFPYLESIKNNIVTLPLYPALSDKEVLKIVKYAKQYQNA